MPDSPEKASKLVSMPVALDLQETSSHVYFLSADPSLPLNSLPGTEFYTAIVMKAALDS